MLALRKPATATAGASRDLRRSSGLAQALDIKLVGANAAAEIVGEEQTAARSNYFIGRDSKKWQTKVPSYSKVRYRNVYPGIDLLYYGSSQHRLEYDFVLAPGADAQAIAMRFRGARHLALNAQGDLVVGLADGGELIHRAPAIYQERRGQREPVGGRCVMRGRDTVGFELAAYDRSRPVYIDPGLVYSTYLGDTGSETGNGIAVDADGNAYIIGTTNSVHYPVTMGSAQDTNPDPGNAVAFITKLNTTGSGIVYSSYLGGTFGSLGNGIAIDSTGSVYVTGETTSNDFPTTTGAFLTAVGVFDVADAFVAKLSPDGSALDYSTYLGGNHTKTECSTCEDLGSAIAVDSTGHAYVSGNTDSSDFPTTVGAFNTTTTGGSLLFVTKLAADGSALDYSTFIGDSIFPSSIAVDSSGNAYAANTTSGNCPHTSGAFQTSSGGLFDACVTKVSTDGKALEYSTFLGGSQSEEPSGIAVEFVEPRVHHGLHAIEQFSHDDRRVPGRQRGRPVRLRDQAQRRRCERGLFDLSRRRRCRQRRGQRRGNRSRFKWRRIRDRQLLVFVSSHARRISNRQALSAPRAGWLRQQADARRLGPALLDVPGRH